MSSFWDTTLLGEGGGEWKDEAKADQNIEMEKSPL